VRHLLRHWPILALVLSLAALAFAHAFETFGHLAPCELCLKEREVYWLAAGVALVGAGLAWRAPRARPWVCALLGLIFVGGGLLAAYHAGVEWKIWPGPQECTGGHVHITIADMNRLLKGGPMGVPRCDKPAFVFLGLSMAGWNAVLSLALAVASLVATRFNRAPLARDGGR
jgi:disulfide bond formation protein DsbB